MRRVKVSKREWKEGFGLTLVSDGEALFHQFGINYEEFENGPGQFTSAIIERDDGKIENIDCALIQFIKELA